MTKPKFSVFLDFDGVLNDFFTIPSLFKFGGFFVKKNDKKAFNPESVEALNILINTLDSRYSVDLILTSFWRFNVDKCRSVLKSNGLTFDGEIKTLPFVLNKPRIKEIENYINDEKIDKYLVIDDFPYMERYFDKSQMIKTHIFNKSLNVSNVLNYIDTYMPELSDSVAIPEIDFN